MMPLSIYSAESIEVAMTSSTLEEGREAYLRGIPQQKCPYTDQARREVWTRGWLEKKAEIESSDA
jgi:ribosome modulation factor